MLKGCLKSQALSAQPHSHPAPSMMKFNSPLTRKDMNPPSVKIHQYFTGGRDGALNWLREEAKGQRIAGGPISDSRCGLVADCTFQFNAILATLIDEVCAGRSGPNRRIPNLPINSYHVFYGRRRHDNRSA